MKLKIYGLSFAFAAMCLLPQSSMGADFEVIITVDGQEQVDKPSDYTFDLNDPDNDPRNVELNPVITVDTKLPPRQAPISVAADTKLCVGADGKVVKGGIVMLEDCNSTKALNILTGPDQSLTVGNKLCLEVSGGRRDNGVPIRFWTCDGSDGQRFIVKADSMKDPITAVIEIPKLGKCVDIKDGRILFGNNLQSWECNKTAAQNFLLSDEFANKAGEAFLEDVIIGDNKRSKPNPMAGIYAFHPYQKNRKLCIVPKGGKPGKGVPLVLGDCSKLGFAWIGDLLKVQRGVFENSNGVLAYRNGGFCMDVAGGSTKQGAKLQLWDCNETGAQQWEFSHLAFSSALHFSNKTTHFCLDAEGGRMEPGTPIIAWPCNFGDNQVWKYEN